MADEYIRKQDVLNLPQNIERNLKGEIVERSVDVGAIEALPSADVVQVVHGEWIHMGCGVFECDKCGERISTNVYVREEASERFKFCPNCGAKMDAYGEE